MDTNLLTNGLLWVGLAVFVIARQFMPRAIRPAAMLGLPLVVGFLGVQSLLASPPPGLAAVLLLAVNLGLGAAMGLVRGVTIRIWHDPGQGWMMQGTGLTLVAWLVSVGLKLGLGLAHAATLSSSDIGLLLAVTFGAQSLVVWARMAGVLPAGVPVRSR
jgi:hypothetical protein